MESKSTSETSSPQKPFAEKSQQELNTGLLKFLQHSPTPFHAVANMASRLSEKGFRQIKEADLWSLETKGRYYVTRNDSSLIAFCIHHDTKQEGFRILGAHTDSPGLKLKANADIEFKNFIQSGTETYGGLLMGPCFDRDLSLAGRIHYQDQSKKIDSALIDLKRPLAIIPSLAIHLDREANQNKSINPQNELIPIWGQSHSKAKNFSDLLVQALREPFAENQVEKILSHELYLYDSQAPSYLGWNREFIASARLDNLLSCYLAMESLISQKIGNRLIVCNDHEEVGSNSAVGADGTFLKDVLERLYPQREGYIRAMQKSFLISCDNAHGIHPNYPQKHDSQHGPLLNAGPVIKSNANQRYATSSETAAMFMAICEELQIPYQNFVMRSDMACGSTIGPMTAAKLGIKTLDVGVPSLAMHSIRELVGSQDTYWFYQALQAFLAGSQAAQQL